MKLFLYFENLAKIYISVDQKKMLLKLLILQLGFLEINCTETMKLHIITIL
jgi:hypothetical protein